MTRSEYNNAVDKYADAIYRFVLKNLKDEEEAKDIVQDVFVKLWLNHAEVNSEKQKSYLFTLAYRQTIDFVRKQKHVQDFYGNREVFTEANFEYFDIQEILHKAVNSLPADQKAVVLLRDFEGYSYQEIAEITKLTEAQVKVYIFRARKTMKIYLSKMELGVK